ncbi:hypothetical protein NPIL_8851 [Nephila pilipes]|uniref:Uncharacterized protein n=1 Tax=Nephila pilipes TaxID=299642 RepID=A0A8X6UKX1_NEPPI|nr:hypothetical protein NPIL_8851 [Nephila pilipes]
MRHDTKDVQKPDFLPDTGCRPCQKQRCPTLLGSYRKFDELAIIRLCIGRCCVCVWYRDGSCKGVFCGSIITEDIGKGFE